MTADRALTGGCLCGGVRYVCGEPVSAPALCHCRSCRRAAGAPAVAWMTVPRDSLRFTRGAPREFASSSPVVRGFCGACGTQLTYWHSEAPECIDVTVATLDEPDAVTPAHHIWMADAVSWDRPRDGLPLLSTSRGAGEPFVP